MTVHRIIIRQRMIWLVALALAMSVTLAACGKKGSPAPDGPADKITYPRAYPAY
jgi:predicted small lipoprotein YifL